VCSSDLDFKTPEEYLELDDYTVWAKLKKCKASQRIISDLEHRRMLKCAYERTFYEKDDMVANLFGQESYRNNIRVEIAKEAGIPADLVNIDVPTVQSVPYHPTMLMQPMEIPVFNRGKAGEKKLQRLSETSKIFETLRGFMNMLLVSTNVEESEKVEKATSKILGMIPSAANISF
jgi:hypothetical protein